MLSKHNTLLLCAGLLGLAGCAHGNQPQPRASANAEQGNARYSQVANDEVFDPDTPSAPNNGGEIPAIGNREASVRSKDWSAPNNGGEIPAISSDNPQKVASNQPPTSQISGAAQGSGTTASGTTGSGTTASGTSGDTGSCELAVYFNTDSAQLDRGSQERLDKVADCIKRHQVDHATIVGQTDPSGTAQHNRELGLERARAVAEYLRGRGVPDKEIRVSSKGEADASKSQQLWPVERRAGIDAR